jgi:hypothetical protein
MPPEMSYSAHGMSSRESPGEATIRGPDQGIVALGETISIREGSAVQYASAGHRVRFETHGVNETLF